jgi:hypothetical protein
VKSHYYLTNRGRKRLTAAILIFFVLLGSVISACGRPMTTINSPLIATDTFISPTKGLEALSTLDPYRRVTAAQSFPAAYEIAKSWHRDAKWYGIIPFTSIERAFAIPLHNNNPSWFFRFGVPEDDREIIIEILNGQVVGTNETKIPGYIEPLLQDLEPLGDRWTMMDNVAVLERYLKEENSSLTRFPYMLIDYRLAMPKGYPHPLWTLYNAQDLTRPIFVIDAITGEVFRQ